MAKNYHATTGIDEFYYGVLDTTDETKIVGTAPERIKFLQEITVSQEQSIEKAYGDNKVAEMATSNGPVEVESQFHKLPTEDKIVLFGLEKIESGLYAFGNTDNPPYVGAVFAKTHEDGSKEWVGLPKGKFTKPEQSAKTKEDGVEFSSDNMKAEFMDRKVTGFTEEKSVIFGKDEKGSTTQRDAIFLAIFGVAYPTETEVLPGA
ncbi:major tail protein [Macrococcus armenti]|uniref:major tail protein n=1 Tax=Macrococcus armenti TaxID=2875764 RepID=UPI001CCC0D83|nr:major tail protein [Macrococcus armenti]UBH14850.1 phage tail protein [Macrococcus armenti]UBH17210.1 phage tail protein [Macrococcus armenti]UBH19475.1 phage tail protein [Macrococcus armenti]